MLKRLRNLLGKSPVPKKDKAADLLTRIRKDKAGNIYNRFKDVREIPAHRLRLAEMAAIEADLGITAKDGCLLIDTAIEKFETWSKSPKSTGLADALSILVELKRRFVSLAEEETLLKLATIYFTMNKEDPFVYNEIDQQAKKNAWNMDQETKDFFLCRGAEITNFFGTTSDKDILTYLKQNQPELKKAAHFLEKSGLGNT